MRIFTIVQYSVSMSRKIRNGYGAEFERIDINKFVHKEQTLFEEEIEKRSSMLIKCAIRLASSGLVQDAYHRYLTPEPARCIVHFIGTRQFFALSFHD